MKLSLITIILLILGGCIRNDYIRGVVAYDQSIGICLENKTWFLVGIGISGQVGVCGTQKTGRMLVVPHRIGVFNLSECEIYDYPMGRFNGKMFADNSYSGTIDVGTDYVNIQIFDNDGDPINLINGIYKNED